MTRIFQRRGVSVLAFLVLATVWLWLAKMAWATGGCIIYSLYSGGTYYKLCYWISPWGQSYLVDLSHCVYHTFPCNG